MAGSPTEPTMEEVRAFAVRLLSDMREVFVDSGALDEAIQAHRDLWVMLYRVDRGDTPELPTSMAQSAKSGA